jgi:hypothetical protein
MKSRIIQFATVLTVVLLSTITASAQRTFLRANVPFAFVAGGVHLPAGEYRVYHPGNPYIVVTENREGTAQVMTYVHPSAMKPGETSTKLLFNKYGDEYFLTQVWTERDQEVHQCFKCQMEQQLISQNRKSTAVIVAARN